MDKQDELAAVIDEVLLNAKAAETLDELSELVAAAVRSFMGSNERKVAVASVIARRDSGADWNDLSDRAKAWEMETASLVLSAAIGEDIGGGRER